jgi:hypothetical protein
MFGKFFMYYTKNSSIQTFHMNTKSLRTTNLDIVPGKSSPFVVYHTSTTSLLSPITVPFPLTMKGKKIPEHVWVYARYLFWKFPFSDQSLSWGVANDHCSIAGGNDIMNAWSTTQWTIIWLIHLRFQFQWTKNFKYIY